MADTGLLLDDPIAFGDLTYFPQQWAAVSAPIGPVLVLAGPGAGKTRCLTGRIRYLVQVGGASPARICGVTFTNKAADEIVHRLRGDLGPVTEHLWLGTIHALCLDLLRPYAKSVDLPPGFGVADDDHQHAILARLRIHHPSRRGYLLRLFGNRRLAGATLSSADETLFRDYITELRRHRLIDYDDIIALTRTLFEEHPDVLAAARSRWDHLLIDEFQDLDPCQYEILNLLAAEHRSVFAVGDDEQSIFSWRGADPSLPKRFQREFGVAAPIVLDVNCRSTVPIFEAARSILPEEAPLFPKSIRAFHPGRPVTVRGFDDDAEEAEWVAEDLLADLSGSGHERGDVAVLYRKHDSGHPIEQALLSRGIPCRLGRGRALLDDPVIGLLVTGLRIVRSPDSELDIEALARRRLPEALFMRLEAAVGGSLLERIEAHARGGHRDAESRSCWRFLYQMENLRQLAAVHGTLPELIEGILALGVGRFRSPLERHIESLTDPADHARAVELCGELARTAAAGGTVFVSPAGGLEIAILHMLRRGMPGVSVRHRRDGAPESGDTVVALGDAGHGGFRTSMVFKALQLFETRDAKRLLTDYVVFDTETTDKDVDSCEVVELAAVRVRGGKPAETFRSLVRGSRPISPGAAAIHGYTDADLAGQPDLAQVWPRFRAFVGDDVLVAHNAYQFDVPVLRRLTSDWGGFDAMPRFDSLPLARELYPVGGVGLGDLATRFQVATGRAHHALDDCHCLAAVLEHLLDEHRRQGRILGQTGLLDSVALGAALEGPSAWSSEDRVLVEAGTWRLFGHHSGALDAYAAEAAAENIACPTVDEIVTRLGGRDLWQRARRESSPQDRYAEAYDRFRQVMNASLDSDLMESVGRFLDTVALSRSDGTDVDPDRVSLLSFHATKGLEFSRVYVVGVEDGELPGLRDLAERREAEIREARRLLYVAMTRAKDRLVLTYVKTRRGQSSGGTRFLDHAGLRPAD